MDNSASGAPNVEAVPEDISMESEQSQDSQQPYQSHSIDEPHASFFQGDQQLENNQGQEQPEPHSPPQRASRPDVAAEDLELGGQSDDQIHKLQLAAQMSQALQNVVGSSTAAEESPYGPQESNLESLRELQDEEPDADVHSQGHDPEAHELPVLSVSIESSSHQDLQQTLRQIIPHPEPQQEPQPSNPSHPPPTQHAYMRSPHQPVLAPATTVVGIQTQYTLGDMTPPRKRSKVSRACDECRRKKVKCDASSETGEETCSNCRRSNVRCMFSRVPQKRGPSKGYIKELADRINSIEGKLGGGQSVAEALAGELVSRQNLGESYAASAQGEDIRKRPFSQISSNNFPTLAPSRPPGWAAEPRPAPSQPSYSANGLALKPILPRASIGLIPSRVPGTDGVTVDSQPAQASPTASEISDNVYNAYLNIVHHVLPFLPASKTKLNAQLAECGPSLQGAFIEALNSAVGSFPGISNIQGSLTRAYRLLTDFDAEGGGRGPVSHLIRLQCLILLIINVDNYGPSSLTGEHEGSPKVELLARAAGFAYFMNIPDEAMTLGPVADAESDECLRVRAWWVLIILDRWNAISSATRLAIPGDAVVLPHNLKTVFGEANYRFTLLAYIMGHWTPASVIAPLNSTPGDGARASAVFHLNMEMWRADFPADIPPKVQPVLHLSYWHCRLLAFLFMPSSLITDVTWAVRESVRLLTSHPQMVSPLNHHFTALTALCLIEMTKVEKSREEATQLLSNLVDANIAPSAWDEAISARIREAIQPSTSTAAQTTASQSLQHLADLATSTEIGATINNAAATAGAAADVSPADKAERGPKFRVNDNYEDLGFDPREMLRTGYLNAISEPSP
ncbi:Glucose-responsive transcription factor [Gnomoniopsis smithogilvyi]|uniref:Glucose-responsive transcription factor n=1 Tax=Gnomoniopsis smithogilvyi TaxID=1191159 RepID=A0A9W9CY25_9PEZI|nr:Glucose-responsive transcription factor [Gnomoniopsis smithogilvyi]